MIATIYLQQCCNIYQIDDSVKCKKISDNDKLSRAYFTPRMGNENGYIWQQIFEFPSNYGLKESVIWRYILQQDDCVHTHNLKHLEAKKLKNPLLNESYSGFFTATAQSIRSETTSIGHGFDVYHAPAEGNWHAEISIILKTGHLKLSKNDKSDVRAIMQYLFKSNFTKFTTLE